MVWKLSDWKHSIEQLQNRYRSFLDELSSVVADEESRLALEEMDAHFETIAAGRNGKDKN